MAMKNWKLVNTMVDNNSAAVLFENSKTGTVIYFECDIYYMQTIRRHAMKNSYNIFAFYPEKFSTWNIFIFWLSKHTYNWEIKSK